MSTVILLSNYLILIFAYYDLGPTHRLKTCNGKYGPKPVVCNAMFC